MISKESPFLGQFVENRRVLGCDKIRPHPVPDDHDNMFGFATRLASRKGEEEKSNQDGRYCSQHGPTKERFHDLQLKPTSHSIRTLRLCSFSATDCGKRAASWGTSLESCFDDLKRHDRAKSLNS